MSAKHSTRPKKIKRVCERCSKEFLGFPCRVNVGLSRYCSRKCSFVPVEERFWNYVGKKDGKGCIIWNGPMHKAGYGQLKDGHGNRILAHRLAYMLVVGPIPEGLGVLHRCDNPPCVNPFHLFVGTQADNNADRDAKGRFPVKLTKQMIGEIVMCYLTGIWTQRDLAKQYHVSPASILRVLRVFGIRGLRRRSLSADDEGASPKRIGTFPIVLPQV